ncbi:MAG: class I SAM-dependent methyltransferase [Anaerolineales bacterium]|nr:class I SAM-dependent methyltransferase [Chloroflexota bacterium]MBL6983297.1 class I SAM-dependent methyltransferase [Anaerolineales bacterium]
MKFPRRFVFNIWYLFNPPWDTNITPPELHEFIEANLPGRALDLGCGTGTNVISLAKNDWDATGIDFAPKAIRSARRKARRAGVKAQFLTQDVTQLDNIEQPFDLVLDIGCFHSLDSQGQKEYRKNLDRLLKPGGSFLLYVFFRNDAASSSSGIIESDLVGFSTQLELVTRQDGSDRETRSSSWLHYRKPNT